MALLFSVFVLQEDKNSESSANLDIKSQQARNDLYGYQGTDARIAVPQQALHLDASAALAAQHEEALLLTLGWNFLTRLFFPSSEAGSTARHYDRM